MKYFLYLEWRHSNICLTLFYHLLRDNTESSRPRTCALSPNIVSRQHRYTSRSCETDDVLLGRRSDWKAHFLQHSLEHKKEHPKRCVSILSSRAWEKDYVVSFVCHCTRCVISISYKKIVLISKHIFAKKLILKLCTYGFKHVEWVHDECLSV